MSEKQINQSQGPSRRIAPGTPEEIEARAARLLADAAKKRENQNGLAKRAILRINHEVAGALSMAADKGPAELDAMLKRVGAILLIPDKQARNAKIIDEIGRPEHRDYYVRAGIVKKAKPS